MAEDLRWEEWDEDAKEKREQAEARARDFVGFRKAWMNEKNAPELLYFQSRLVTSVQRKLSKQLRKIEEYDANEDERFQNKLLQMDAERVKFLVADYLRVRLQKIMACPIHVMQNAEYHERLSEEEKTFTLQYIDAIESHFSRSCLQRLPESLRRLDEPTKDVVGMDMISSPALDEFVCCRTLEDIEGLLSNDDPALGRTIELKANELVMLRYKPVRALLESGKVALV